MGNPILYYIDLSPPSRAVLLTAKRIGLELDKKVVDLLGSEQLKPEFIKLNPQHTVPLLDDNGTIIYDSHAICAYLVQKYGKEDTLYPKDLVERAGVDARLHFDTGYLFARLRFLFEPVLYFKAKTLPQEKIDYIEKCWPILERFLETNEYVCGKTLTIADFSCISSVCSLDQLVPIDAQKYPKLLNWIKRMETLPYYDEICGAHGKTVQAIVKKMGTSA